MCRTSDIELYLILLLVSRAKFEVEKYSGNLGKQPKMSQLDFALQYGDTPLLSRTTFLEFAV